MFDDQAVGPNSIRNAMRTRDYQSWLDAVRGDDFLGVQNCKRILWGDKGKPAPPEGSDRDSKGAEVYARSLAGAVRFAHAVTGCPIVATERGVGTPDDSICVRLIPAALAQLKRAMDDGASARGSNSWPNWRTGWDSNPR